MNVAESWHEFLINVAYAKDYQVYFLVAGGVGGLPPKNPILEQILPSLLFVKSLTILDAGLEEVLVARHVSLRAMGYRDDLNGRIKAAGDLGIIPDSELLHDARRARNDVAHEFSNISTWGELETAISNIQEALAAMGLVGPRPNYKVAGGKTRASAEELTDPKAIFGLKCHVSVLDEAGKEWGEIKWIVNIYGTGGRG